MNAMFTVHGAVTPGFEPVEAAFRENFERRGEVGAAACAWHDGEKVVDLWGGLADRENDRPWNEDTLAVIFSSTEGMVALCLLMLADRGKLDYDCPVADYWPEFAAGGKETITVRELLNHRAGLAVVERPLPLSDWCEPTQVGRALASQRPQWKPGADQGYGAISAGAYAAELFRRIDGRSLGRFFADEVAGPLDADAFIGLPADLETRVATLYPANLCAARLRLLPEILTGRTVEGRLVRALLVKRSLPSRAFGNPDLGRKGLALAMGGALERTRLCRPESVEPLKRRQSWSERDRVVLKPLGFSQGFLKEECHVFSPGEEAFGHSGMGGALGLADPDRRLAFAYVMNRAALSRALPRAVRLHLTERMAPRAPREDARQRVRATW
jgi:CubicO group peptidase (beta-lactamase class C family)